MAVLLLERLGDKGYKETHQRKLIIKALESGRKHPTAYELYVYLRQKKQQIGISTVYRNLELLCTLGLVTKLELGGKSFRYELAGRDGEENNHHHHLVCLGCGKVIDFKSNFMLEADKIIRKLSFDYKFKITTHELTIFSYCQKCHNI